MDNHELYMQRCVQLALKGIGSVAPNPMVGSVLVYKDQIIAEGYHHKYGEAHAEVNAINSLQDQSLLEQCTLYVNLEPCAHYGKTPPCSDFIILKKIPRVVIGCVDSFSEVSGKGIEKLRAAGVDVTVGILERESRELNKRFFTFHEKKRPYIILKWAQTLDGFMDIDRSKDQKGIALITEPATKSVTHRWRHEEAAILVGWKTVAIDNPHLTCRDSEGTNPVRVVIDRDLRLDYNAFHVGDRKAKTIILTQKTNVSGDENLQFVSLENFTTKNILKILWKLNLQSVIIEGGKTTLEHFIQEKLWDEARVLTGKIKFQSGQSAPHINGKKTGAFNFGNDHIQLIENA